MSDVFYEMSKVTIKPVVNYTVLQIFLISSLPIYDNVSATGKK